MVASLPALDPERRRRLVSIPFIAGQWSLPLHAHSDRFSSGRLNPLHCGAVVASRCAAPRRAAAGGFQSPSLRGSGRFRGGRPESAPTPPSFNPLHCGAVVASIASTRRLSSKRCFNPLHCGAVVASCSWRSAGRSSPGFNPLHCGAVVASGVRDPRAALPRRVSIPFIAGQWSLPHRRLRRGRRMAGFNPLHCGAVVASR